MSGEAKEVSNVDIPAVGTIKVDMASGRGSISGQTGLKLGPEETLDGFLQKKKEEAAEKAQYKIEIIFSRHRSSLLHKPSPLMLLMWESGKRFHGGGDQKLYWCGYDDCNKFISQDHFALQHCICSHCNRENFLDEGVKADHIREATRSNQDIAGLHRMPCVVGERLANLTPPKLAELLEKTWRMLNGDADIYLKYSPYEIRYDAGHETTQDLDRLEKVRVQRTPLIYTLRNILKDISAGADLRKRFQVLITS